MMRWMCGVHWNMHIPSAKLRQHLGIHGIEESLTWGWVRYYGHLLCMLDDPWPKLELGQRVAGRHPRGRPCKSGWNVSTKI